MKKVVMNVKKAINALEKSLCSLGQAIYKLREESVRMPKAKKKKKAKSKKGRSKK